MSREAEISINSVGVAGISSPSQPRKVAIISENEQSSTLKRRRDIKYAGESTAKRQAVQDIVFRILVPSKDIEKIIGQGGHRIQKVREYTKATIKIADAVTRHEERVIIICSGDVEDAVTDAEKALQQIVNLILQEDDKSLESVGHGHLAVNSNTIKLLIAGSQAGSLIGLSGQNFKKLRMTSGATNTSTIFAQNQLPFCASACESDRVVQVSGDRRSVVKAIDEIGIQLSWWVNWKIRVQQYSIRNESGAMVKVNGGKGEQKHRYIQFGGDAEQVTLAKQRVDECIYSQLIQQPNSHQ